MMQSQAKGAPHLTVVPALSVDSLDNHADRAAKLIVDLIELWKLSLTEEMSPDSVARVGFNIVMANLRMVELRALARSRSEPEVHYVEG